MSYGRSAEEEAALSRSLYFTDGYFSPEQWMSFRAQVDAVRRLAPRSVLEVGLGNGIVSTILRHLGIQVATADINPHLHPDVLASLTELASSVGPASCDVALCAEVMEHMPFDLLDLCLENLAAVTRDCAVVTLPDVLRGLTLRGQVWRWRIDLHWGPHSRRLPPEHHWHIGSHPATHLQAVLAHMECRFQVENHYRCPGNPMHRLFVLRKRDHASAVVRCASEPGDGDCRPDAGSWLAA